MSILKLENVCFSYGTKTVLEGISYEFEKGKMYAVVGKSGAGKTTLLSVLSGLASPGSGTITYNGEDIRKIDKYRFRSKYIGVIFQSFNLLTKFTALENVELSMDIAGVKGKTKEKREQAMALLSSVGLDEDEANRRILKLSGGQQQRVAIARALVNRPKVLLLDEPLGALDLKLRKGMQIELKRMQQKLGITFIYVTHDQEEALTMSDTIVVMNEGVIQQIGTPVDIYNEPKNIFVAKFIGESNILPGIMLGDYKVRFHGREFTCVDAGFGSHTPVDVVVRPEDIDLYEESRSSLTGVVKSVLFMGVHYEFRVDTGDFVWTVHSTDYIEPGSRVSLTILPDAIHIMHKSVNPDEQEMPTEDERFEAALAEEAEA